MDPKTDGEVIQTGTGRFELLSGKDFVLRAYDSPDGKKMLHGVASSTTRDLHGDVIMRTALDDMERAAVGMTIFLNHSYNVPEDVAGTVDAAIIKAEGADQDGEPNYSLHYDIEIEDDNPEAVQSHKYVKKGRKLGLSIGAMIPPGGARKQKDGSYIIDHIQLLETSIVGIPANPKSWVQYAKSALDLATKAKTTQLGNPTLTLDGDSYRIEGSLQGLELNLGGLPDDVEPVPVIDFQFKDVDGKVEITRTVTTGPNRDEAVLGTWDLADAEQRLTATATAGELAVTKATVWVETRDGDKITIGEPPETNDGSTAITDTTTPDVTDAGCPDCGGSKGSPKGSCSNAYHNASAEPDVTDAKVRIIEVDTDDNSSSGDSQGASSSEPDDADTLAASPADVTASAEPVILDDATADELLTLSFRQLQAAALALLSQQVEMKRQYDEEKQARIVAETEKQRVIDAAGDLVKRTNEVLDKVANSPLTRKAVAREATSASASLTAFYGEELARRITGS